MSILVPYVLFLENLHGMRGHNGPIMSNPLQRMVDSRKKYDSLPNA